MTNELAIKILTGEVLGTTEQTDEAVKMAVKALSLQDVAYINVGDTISRQDAIDLLKKWSGGYIYIETETESSIKDFQQLPSVQPETSRIENALHGKTAEEQCDFIRWLVHDYAMCFTDSRQAIIEWLKGGDPEHTMEEYMYGQEGVQT